MSFTLRDIAELVGGQLHGNPDTLIHGAATLSDAGPQDITLADRPQLAEQLAACPAAAAVVARGVTPANKPYVVVENVHAAFAKIVARFRPQRVSHAVGVSPAAFVSPTAKIGSHVVIHPMASVAEDVEIGEGTTIHSGVHLLPGCKIGQHVTIFPNAVLYENTIVGDRCIIHANAVIGAYGFGYEVVNGRHKLSAQLGNVQIGPDVEIGAGSTIDRGTYGTTTIGEGTKIDNQVQVAHNCHIGRHNILCSQVGIAGSSKTGDYVVMGGQVGVRDHVTIADQVKLGGKAGVMTDLPTAGTYLGAPCMPEREQKLLLVNLSRVPEMRKQLKEMQHQLEELTSAITQEAA